MEIGFTEEKAPNEAANITFRMAASLRSFSIAKLPDTVRVALFGPYLCEPKWREIKRMARLNLDVGASTPQESPDSVIYARHSRLQHPTPRQEIRLTPCLVRCPHNPSP